MAAKKEAPLKVAAGCSVTYKGKLYLEGEKIPDAVSEEEREFLVKSKQVLTDESDTAAKAD